MADEHELEQAFIGAVNGLTRHFVVVDATVTAVDADPTNPESTFTCTVLVGQTSYYQVPIRVLMGSQASIMPVPVIGSDCRLAFMDGNIGRPILYDCDQIQDFLIATVGNTVFNGGNNGGMVLLNPLVTKLNNLEKLVNDLIVKFNAHTHNVTAVGSPTGPNLDQETGTLVPTQPADIQNTKITQ